MLVNRGEGLGPADQCRGKREESTGQAKCRVPFGATFQEFDITSDILAFLSTCS